MQGAKPSGAAAGYLPSMLLPRMATLTQSGRSAAPMVDGPLAMADLLEPQGTRTVLVGGLGAGGAGLFALDTMLAAQGSESEAARAVLWEITPLTPGFANLGEAHALPRFTRLNDPARTPAVVVGNGYFNAGIRTSANASGLLLLFTDGRTANANAAEAGLRLQYRDGTTTDRLTDLTPFLNADARATPTGPRRAIPSSGRYNWREFTPSWTEASPAPNTGSR